MNFEINELLKQSAQEAVDISEEKAENIIEHKILVSSGIDVKKIRENLGLSRTIFCEIFGLRIRTVEKWEQGKSRMDSTAISYLTTIANNPEAVRNALAI